MSERALDRREEKGKMSKQIQFQFSIVLLALTLTAKTYADEIITDERIREVFGKSQLAKKAHSVMATQKDHMMEILEGYLTGDTEEIKKSSQALAKNMRKVALEFQSEQDEDTVVWASMSEIVNQSRALQVEAQNGNYAKSYQHFTQLTSECIKCHQLSRRWGRFPTPSPTPEAAESPKAASSPAPSPAPAPNKRSGRLSD